MLPCRVTIIVTLTLSRSSSLRRGGVTDIDFGAMFGGFDDDEGDDDEPMPLDEVP